MQPLLRTSIVNHERLRKENAGRTHTNEHVAASKHRGGGDTARRKIEEESKIIWESRGPGQADGELR